MTTTATKPSDYLHIAVWGRQLGSMRYYIVDQQERAFAAGAPINAIYERSGPGGTRSGVWVTVDECVPHRRDHVNAEVETLRAALQKRKAA